MNYYPNYYANNYPSQYTPQTQNYMPQMTQIPTPQPTTLGINGKIVDSPDVARATEVPIGGYGVFPKADLSEIYIKSWNNNGTTSVITYKPEPLETVQQGENIQSNSQDLVAEILNKINSLETKIDNLSTATTTTVRKEVKNEY